MDGFAHFIETRISERTLMNWHNGADERLLLFMLALLLVICKWNFYLFKKLLYYLPTIIKNVDSEQSTFHACQNGHFRGQVQKQSCSDSQSLHSI
jgi:hypothetical protein